MFRSFLRNRRGSVLPIFAIAAVPLIVATGAAVDYGNAFHGQTLVQDGLDSAALAANKLLGVVSDDRVEAEARNVFKANVDLKSYGNPPIDVEVGGGAVEVSTTLHVPTYFLGMIGMKEFVYDLTARSVAGAETYEVALVLDNSGSMAGSKISSLRSAAANLTNVLFDVNKSNPKKDPVKIGLVPFTAAVNVGSAYRSATWLDQGTVGTYASEDFDKRVGRFDLFDRFRDVSWQGCVQARPHPYDVEDATPVATNPSSLFEPMFAPDEPDTSRSYSNSYLSDYAGSCTEPVICPSNWSDKKCAKKGGVRAGPTDAALQAQVCKYDNARLSSRDNGVSEGPNYNCTARPLQPLTTNQSQILSRINDMEADGMTNIHAGVMWGWRLLSPGAPFSEGRSYDTDDNRKIMIVMTDGENTYTTNSTFDKSMYGAFGFVANGHLGTTSSSDSVVVAAMNDRTLQACANAKGEAGILIYTVAFQVRDKNTLQMLRDCASRSDMAFQSDSNSDLIDAFKEIAQQISVLRLES